MDELFPIFGIALIAVAMLQFGLWTGRGLRLRKQEKKKFTVELDRLRAELFQIRNQSIATSAPSSQLDQQLAKQSTETADSSAVQAKPKAGDWTGFRQFKVARLVQETTHCMSVYLTPVDGQPIAEFLPGQHLTLKFPVPGKDKSPIRCYTLSDAANEAYYRISVKRCMPPRDKPNAPPGLVSYYVNGDLKEGDIIDVKSPSGTFFVQPGSGAVVLLAGGIGITPMLSILNSIVQSGSGRECLLVYGVGNNTDHAFKKHFENIAAEHSNIHVVTCYCNPNPEDVVNKDYQVKGFVSIDVLKQILPNNNYDFYLCGPPPFMQSIYNGLSGWGVDDERIRYEAFGPATIKKKKTKREPANDDSQTYDVTFGQSNRTESWTGKHENLLEFMEDKDVAVDSGCRAGSCGTCQTRLLKGKVRYDDAEQIECEEGHCLPCVAKPVEAIEIDV